jgi:hypothetical protein
MLQNEQINSIQNGYVTLQDLSPQAPAKPRGPGESRPEELYSYLCIASKGSSLRGINPEIKTLVTISGEIFVSFITKSNSSDPLAAREAEKSMRKEDLKSYNKKTRSNQ